MTSIEHGNSLEPIAIAPVRCVHGANEQQLPVAGRTVGWVRRSFRDALNFGPGAIALVDGEPVDESHLLRPGAILEFLDPLGRKGLGEVFTPERLIERMGMSEADFEDMVAEGLPVHRLRDGTLRITEAQLDAFLDRIAGLGAGTDGPSPLPTRDRIPTDEGGSRGRSPYLDAGDAAAYLDITKGSLYGLVERGRLTPLRGPRRRYRFTTMMLDDYLKRGDRRG